MSDTEKPGGNDFPHTLFILADDGYHYLDSKRLSDTPIWNDEPGETTQWLKKLEAAGAILAIHPKLTVTKTDPDTGGGQVNAVLCMMLNYAGVLKVVDHACEEAFKLGANPQQKKSSESSKS